MIVVFTYCRLMKISRGFLDDCYYGIIFLFIFIFVNLYVVVVIVRIDFVSIDSYFSIVVSISIRTYFPALLTTMNYLLPTAYSSLVSSTPQSSLTCYQFWSFGSFENY